MDLKGPNLGWKNCCISNNRKRCISKRQSLYNVTNESISMGLNQGWTKRRRSYKNSQFCVKAKAATIHSAQFHVTMFYVLLAAHLISQQYFVTVQSIRFVVLCPILFWIGQFWAHQSVFHTLCVVSTLVLIFSSLWQNASLSNIYSIYMSLRMHYMHCMHCIHV